MTLKLCCDECVTVFYVLKNSFECPRCGHKVNPKQRFGRNQAAEEEVEEESAAE